MFSLSGIRINHQWESEDFEEEFERNHRSCSQGTHRRRNREERRNESKINARDHFFSFSWNKIEFISAIHCPGVYSDVIIRSDKRISYRNNCLCYYFFSFAGWVRSWVGFHPNVYEVLFVRTAMLWVWIGYFEKSCTSMQRFAMFMIGWSATAPGIPTHRGCEMSRESHRGGVSVGIY